MSIEAPVIFRRRMKRGKRSLLPPRKTCPPISAILPYRSHLRLCRLGGSSASRSASGASGPRSGHPCRQDRRSAGTGLQFRRGRYGARAGAAGDGPRRRRNRRHDCGRAAGDRRLPRLRRFHPGSLLWWRVSMATRSRSICVSASTRRFSVTAIGWMSRATTCSGISPKTMRFCSTPRPISPGISCPTPALSAPGAPARSSRPWALRACAPGSIISRHGKWRNSTPPLISRSISRG